MKTSANRPAAHFFLVFVYFIFSTIFLTAQNRQDYYIAAKPNYSLEPLQKTTNLDGTLTLDLVDSGLEAFFNSLPVYYFKKEFTSTNSPFLMRFYKITLDDDSHFNAIFDRSEIEYVEVLRTQNHSIYQMITKLFLKRLLVN